MKELIQILIICGIFAVLGGNASGQTLSQEEMDAEYEKSEEAKNNKNYKRVAEIVKPLAKQGHIKSQSRLGAQYLLGLGVQKNYDEALRLLQLAAEKGNSKAEEFIGIAYTNGWGVSKDIKTAIKWFERAVANGNLNAKENLGKTEYLLGAEYWNKYPNRKYSKLNYENFPPHKKKGFKWFLRSEKHGNLKAKEVVTRLFGNWRPPLDPNNFTPNDENCSSVMEPCEVGCSSTLAEMKIARLCDDYKRRKEEQRELDELQRMAEERRVAEEKRIAEENRLKRIRRKEKLAKMKKDAEKVTMTVSNYTEYKETCIKTSDKYNHILCNQVEKFQSEKENCRKSFIKTQLLLCD